MKFYPISISNIQKETDKAVCLTFDVPPEHKDKFEFIQGQYLTLQTDIDGDEIRRSYSICSGVDDDKLQVGIKQVEGGVFSTFANQQLQAGDSLQAAAPQGNFYTTLETDKQKRYMCICAGSGITPILSIVKSILSREPDSHVTLLFGNRNSNTVMFKQQLGYLKNRYMQRFQWLNILSAEQQDAEVLFGRLDNNKGRRVAGQKINPHTIHG